jgi:hypothetical protein
MECICKALPDTPSHHLLTPCRPVLAAMHCPMHRPTLVAARCPKRSLSVVPPRTPGHATSHHLELTAARRPLAPPQAPARAEITVACRTASRLPLRATSSSSLHAARLCHLELAAARCVVLSYAMVARES